jgi:hypothetical protein
VSFHGNGYSYQVDVRGLREPVKVDVPTSAFAFPVGTEVEVGFEEEMCVALPGEG